MPIQIRELTIKATVSDEQSSSLDKIDLAKLKEKIMAECVETVLQILEDKKKR